MHKIMVTGGAGQIGHEVCQQAKRRGLEVIALSSKALDICQEQRVRDCLERHRPDVLINAAGYSDVDQAEKQPDVCYAVNQEGVYNLAKACKQLAIPLLHISSDFVFDGSKASPYVETDEVSPLGVYGDSKWQGEQLVRSLASQHLILRVCWVFSPRRTNFLTEILGRAKQQETIQLITDQQGCPTAAADVARVLIAMAEQSVCVEQLWGTYHYCSNEEANWFEFARQIIEEARAFDADLQVKNLQPISVADTQILVERPANSVLDASKILSHFGIVQRPWRTYVAQAVASYYQQSFPSLRIEAWKTSRLSQL